MSSKYDLVLEDKIVKLRFILGIVYGFIAYILYRLNIVLFMDNSVTIWFLAGIFYIPSIYYVSAFYGVNKWFPLLMRGLLTYYLAWITIVLVLYGVLG